MMRELTKSIGSFSWAMSLFGMRQMVGVLRPAEAAEAFDSVTKATEDELGELLRLTFQMGDRMQRSMVDMTFMMFSPEALDPRAWSRTLSQATGGVSEATSAAARGVAAESRYGAAAGPVPPPRGREAESGWAATPAAAPGPHAPARRVSDEISQEPTNQSGWGPMGP
jgi:hypothetical protein